MVFATCIVHGCRSASYKDTDLRFFQLPVQEDRFPTDPNFANRWIQNVRVSRNDDKWKPSKYTRICSTHFLDKYKYTTKGGQCRLHPHAVPTEVMPSCVVKYCKNNTSTQKKSDGVTFHMRNLWIRGCQRPDLLEMNETTLKHKYVCGLHFENNMFSRKNLKKIATPTLNLPKTQSFSVETQTDFDISYVGSSQDLPHDTSTYEYDVDEWKFSGQEKRKRGFGISSDVSEDVPSTSGVCIKKKRGSSDDCGLRRINSDIEYICIDISPTYVSDCVTVGNDQLIFPQQAQAKDQHVDNEPSLSDADDDQPGSSYDSEVVREQEPSVEEITIKEETVEEEGEQCRLCLSVGRKMWPLGDYEALYRKLLFDIDYGNSSGFMSQLLACWECNAMLRKIQHFQDRVRRAKVAFETSQNRHIETLSTLSKISTSNIEPNNANVHIKEEVVEMELEIEPQIENECADPLQIEQGEHNAEDIRRKGIKKKKDPKEDILMDCDNIFGIVKIEMEELEKMLEDRRAKESYKCMKYKCDFCVLGFTDEGRLLEHQNTFHHEDVGSEQCGICARRYGDERQLAAHYRNHFVKFVCRLCSYECYTKSGRMMHFKRHKQDTTSDSVLRKFAAHSQATPGGSA